MKKAIWIILPIVIVAIVLVAVFVSQRNTYPAVAVMFGKVCHEVGVLIT